MKKKTTKEGNLKIKTNKPVSKCEHYDIGEN